MGSTHQSYQNHSDCQNIGKSNITFLYTNADSLLLNKINELKARLSLFHPDILAISEVCPKHFHVTIPLESLHLQGYDFFCSDFLGGRGVCLCYQSVSLVIFPKVVNPEGNLPETAVPGLYVTVC